MTVGVDQPRHHRIAMQIHYPRTRRERGSPALNGQDVIALDHDRCIFQRRAAGAIDHPHVGQSGDSRGRVWSCGERYRPQREQRGSPKHDGRGVQKHGCESLLRNNGGQAQPAVLTSYVLGSFAITVA